ncbi:hypothetical protein HanRHA438_Chr05g0227031 [Helianthus annuus]|uniref:Uncharacterized protein n=1 Tax=Helianthus annuus TaxID=4232 RepID=A0A251RVA0_HELAN|nr:hypothetical protein HanXRQr2_Chr17g0830031 [Helianthus annuus]KAF5760196.1 hypothetical protein HanXRQr2_Chr16g0750561 [Helianthus annuus]KAF5806145.1 hypothetical protein HanXRQr2_Chr05g0217891 [Helianthus annuus]KAJ0431054.1 hypothetical protein HanHA300_Chr17g0676031 [Helianthus annuus]KAJ0438279.1 hypothetical protein HanHA300_Chr16g0612131 [Helianthus annuus]
MRCVGRQRESWEKRCRPWWRSHGGSHMHIGIWFSLPRSLPSLPPPSKGLLFRSLSLITYSVWQRLLPTTRLPRSLTL